MNSTFHKGKDCHLTTSHSHHREALQKMSPMTSGNTSEGDEFARDRMKDTLPFYDELCLDLYLLWLGRSWH